MKYIFTFFALTLMSLPSQAGLWEDLNSCEWTCDFSCRELTQTVVRKARKVQRVCNFRPQPPRPELSIEAWRSDTCSSSYLASFNRTTNCSEMASHVTSYVWAVKLGEVCYNTHDMPFLSACNLLKELSSPRSVKFYRSDSCSGGLMAAVSPRTDCNEFSQLTNTYVWAIEVNGECRNINDTSFLNACQLYKHEN